MLLCDALVTSGPELKLRAMSGSWPYCSQGLQQVPVGIEGHVDDRDLGQS